MRNLASEDDTDAPPDGDIVEGPLSSEMATSSNFFQLLADVTTLAWNLVLPIVGGVLLGRYLDDRLDQDYTWTLSLLMLGVLVAFSNLYNLYIEHGQVPRSQNKERPQEETRDEDDEDTEKDQ